MDYNKTINLPQTEFPMRAGLPNREPGMLENWEKLDLYHELLKKNRGQAPALLSTTALRSPTGKPPHGPRPSNKSIKDFITRMYAMRGYYTPYIPGWDNHGMPIESAIIKEQKLNRKKMSVPRVPYCLPQLRPEVHRHPDGRFQAHGRHRRLGAPLQDHGPPALRPRR